MLKSESVPWKEKREQKELDAEGQLQVEKCFAWK